METGTSETRYIPPNYYNRRHPKRFFKLNWVLIALAIPLAATVVWLVITTPDRRPTILGVGAAALAVLTCQIYRKLWVWRHETIKMDPRTGLGEITQPENPRLLIRGSTVDTFRLRGVVSTPTRSWLELLIFKRSHSIIIPVVDPVTQATRNVVLQDVLDVELIIEIQQYRAGFEQINIDQMDRLIAIGDTTNELLRRLIAIGDTTNELLEQRIKPPERESVRLTNARRVDPPVPSLDDTTEIPAIPGPDDEIPT